ncbi:hypothetical protein [Bacillus sp. FJAT-27245]|uniref:hypothetical protein n=1 Tax=Bacillus sp. FJAT-27245 TaxID=1684144 RepID=UPI0006A78952|nr:hypothetical protein [Bacillus sp. FJAT-27245]
MSDYVIKLLPWHPEFIPSFDAIKEAELFVKSVSNYFSDIQLLLTDEVRFIDLGENFETVSCQFCHSDLSIDWWVEAMSEADTSQFTNLQVIVPCCHMESSLNDLNYKWNAGFARFSIEFYNPIVDNFEVISEKLEEILSCEFRKVWACY